MFAEFWRNYFGYVMPFVMFLAQLCVFLVPILSLWACFVIHDLIYVFIQNMGYSLIVFSVSQLFFYFSGVWLFSVLFSTILYYAWHRSVAMSCFSLVFCFVFNFLLSSDHLSWFHGWLNKVLCNAAAANGIIPPLIPGGGDPYNFNMMNASIITPLDNVTDRYSYYQWEISTTNHTYNCFGTEISGYSWTNFSLTEIDINWVWLPATMFVADIFDAHPSVVGITRPEINWVPISPKYSTGDIWVRERCVFFAVQTYNGVYVYFERYYEWWSNR